MANPYSKYTGTRISAVPSGYLAAAASSAEGVRKSGEKFGDMIAATIAKYYEGKREDADDERLASLASSFAYKTDDEESVPLTEEPEILGEDVERTREDKYRAISDAVAQQESAQPHDEAGVLKSIETYEAAVEAQENWKPDPAELAALAKPKEPRSLQDKYAHLNEGLQQFLGDREKMSSKAFREGLTMYQSEKKRVTEQHRWEAEEKRLGAAKSATASALTEKVALLDANAEALGWNPEELAAAKVQIAGVMKSGANITADVQRFEAMKKQPFYAKASDDQKDTLDQIFFGVAPSEAAETRKAKEKVDKSNREGFVALLREQAKLPPALIDEVAKLGSFSAMDTWYDNLSDDQKGMMPADARTWAAIKDGFPANTPPDEIEKYRKIHFGLEDRESLTPNQKEMAAFVTINTDPTKTPEEKIRAGYMYGVYSGPETARRYFEEWDANNIGATDEDRDEQRALLGLPTGVEAEHAQVKLELDQIRLADAKKVEAAMAAGTSGVQVMAIPGITSHQFVKMPTQDHWTLINIGTNAAVDDPVTEEDRNAMNVWLENAGISYRWVKDPTAPSGSRYSPMGGYNWMRPPSGGGGNIPVPGAPAANPQSGGFIPEGKFPENVPRDIPIGDFFKVGGMTYERVKGGANLVK